MASRTLSIGIVGLGTVGTGVIRLIEENAMLIARRSGQTISIGAITARDRNKDRGVDLRGYRWVDDMLEMADDPELDIIVELIGGSDGPALTLAKKALTNGKSLVTANKAMIAHHGLELAELAETNGAALHYEAAVAGGIPAIKGVREGTAANRIERIYGILNGTSNYILSTMETSGRDFDDVLAEAQALGYAEADPSFDIDGVDAAHKLSILASLAFASRLDFDAVATEGIRAIQAADIAQADALGYRIRLLGLAERHDGDKASELFQRVHPYLVPKSHPLANVDGSTNAVVAEGNFSGRLLFQGAGAGDGPTASAVVADIIAIARGELSPAFAMPVKALEPCAPAESGHRIGRAYLRFQVADKPGVLAEITAALRDADVSIESLIQKERSPNDAVLVAMVTHECAESQVNATLDALAGSSSLLGEPMVIHILGDE
ncbi:homoserine dehydrogenase [Alterisphingorhabdus coralli]|uniref:Homoserine dehydrogenase n=1 Tax=Alterisphingorhabdus coralli TaxID=3071408 RepID=A0AA97F7T3_9SPHN|nr:homoserine dehydrogenase [Parasphingorhabdus sp. SCSIO 66989]WOE74857.1 homoserine dehydrogenase [Parasphingorhabdus sp. SCSIO 66989]